MYSIPETVTGMFGGFVVTRVRTLASSRIAQPQPSSSLTYSFPTSYLIPGMDLGMTFQLPWNQREEGL